jgi:gas vesicle protein
MIMKEEMTDKGIKLDKGINMMVPFLVGGVVGAGVALLLAPKPGKEVRNDIKRFATTTKDRAILAIDKGKELYEEGRKAVESAIDAGKTAYVHEKEKWQHA